MSDATLVLMIVSASIVAILCGWMLADALHCHWC
jgi:hypothetical protein